MLCASAQKLTQTIRGRISQHISGAPLQGANVKIVAEEVHGATTDSLGNFAMEVPVGRYKAVVSFTGYETLSQEVLVIAGRETIVNVGLNQAENILKEIEVEGMSPEEETPGLRSLSIEKTLRIPANFFDPVRAVTAYPGVVAANDQGNTIIVRGNSPNGLLWRLNDVDIVNPNHLANAGTFSDRPVANGGGVNMLSAQMLDHTNFYMGAMPANLGNALAGVIDMRLREGNREKHEYTAQASLIGLDVAAEGPINHKHNSSFLVNYRYSTVGVLSALGVNFGDEAITFQDLSFNFSFNQKNGGHVSVFGFWGDSRDKFKAKDTMSWEFDKDKYNINYASTAYAVGLNYSTPLAKGKFSWSAALSSSDQKRNGDISMLPAEFNLIEDRYASDHALISSNMKYQAKVGNRSFWEIGMMTNYQRDDLNITRAFGCLNCNTVNPQLKGEGDGILLQPYTSWNTTLFKNVDLNAGLRYLYFTYNHTGSLEPRISLNVPSSSRSGFNLSYSLVSRQQLAQVYFVPGNSNLGFTKSHHADLDYRYSLGHDMKLRTGIFYQHLFNVPVEQDPSSTFSAINLLDDLAPSFLVNRGTGENYGVDAMVERKFYGTNYIMIGGSYYQSKYTAADGIKRDSRYNGRFTFTTVYGKEWSNLSKHRTIGLNARALYLGGLRESPVDVYASSQASETVFRNTNPFSNKLADYFRIDVRVSFRKDKPGYTRTFAIDLLNVLGHQNEAYHYYDLTQRKVVTKYQLGLIPIIVYRIDF